MAYVDQFHQAWSAEFRWTWLQWLQVVHRGWKWPVQQQIFAFQGRQVSRQITELSFTVTDVMDAKEACEPD